MNPNEIMAVLVIAETPNSLERVIDSLNDDYMRAIAVVDTSMVMNDLFGTYLGADYCPLQDGKESNRNRMK
jgi:hypothetical protein